jgi:hypothetical protein
MPTVVPQNAVEAAPPSAALRALVVSHEVRGESDHERQRSRPRPRDSPQGYGNGHAVAVAAPTSIMS